MMALICRPSTELQKCEKVKDFGAIIDSNLSFDEHIHEKVNKAHNMLSIIINRNS